MKAQKEEALRMKQEHSAQGHAMLLNDLRVRLGEPHALAHERHDYKEVFRGRLWKDGQKRFFQEDGTPCRVVVTVPEELPSHQPATWIDAPVTRQSARSM